MKTLTKMFVIVVVMMLLGAAAQAEDKCAENCDAAARLGATAQLNALEALELAKALGVRVDDIYRIIGAGGMNQNVMDAHKHADTEIGKMHKNDIPTPTNDGVKCHEGEAIRKYASTGPGGKSEYFIECRPHQEAASSSEYDSAEARLRARRAAEAKGDGKGNTWLAIGAGVVTFVAVTAGFGMAGWYYGQEVRPGTRGSVSVTENPTGSTEDVSADYTPGRESGALNYMGAGLGLGMVLGGLAGVGVGLATYALSGE